jgi:hypothetical protein
MVKVVVSEDDSLTAEMAGYTFHFYTNVDGKMVFERWIGNGHRKLVLDPADDGIARNPGDVSLERNLTVARLPEIARGAALLRVVVWDWDPDTKRRSVHDIVEGEPKQLIRFFNRKRDEWIGLGCDPTARIEVVPQDSH